MSPFSYDGLSCGGDNPSLDGMTGILTDDVIADKSGRQEEHQTLSGIARL
jgi:hypothetical protein